MIQITDKKKCCGCTACMNICPRDAIHMEPDSEGFAYPVADSGKCVNCGLCEAVCPVLHNSSHEEETECCIARNRDPAIVSDSTSGGMFTAIAAHFLQRGGVVYGAGYDENMRVVCKKADSLDGIVQMRGSKFVQSDPGNAYTEIRSLLKQGTPVLFSGTPCQVSGLVSFLREKPENLFCLDFVCRGVPSPGLWKNYVDRMEKKYHSKMVFAKFKNKTYGYHATTMKVDFANGKSWYGSGRIDPMMKAFVNEMASRPSCSSCAFKGVERWSDITMFDCYGFTKITGLKDDNKGYSSLLIHTTQGKALFEAIRDQLTVYPAELDKLVDKNGVMVYGSAKPNPKRDLFYEYAAQMPIDKAMARVSPITRADYVIEFGKGVLNRLGLIVFLKKLRRRKRIAVNTNTAEK